ncbi:MAG: bifunctional riboflavin kinase/FAD synthetase [Atribacterota bacterium]|nr:bifunctional riboflavin kinase/FAD synthetase [Atribacterota bacterium]MDD4896561.1 bifunctional riboflavin kinase/FAD synthetase [Atribacterota bacterium]MDD5636265.1 bifunctional riboflavin kinase/FAD synthetase [Atribacterota bacterium]
MKSFQYKYLLRKKLLHNKKLFSYIALGFFDGMHLGHQALLRLCIEKARHTDALSTVILLEPHPEKIVNKIDNFSLLTTLSEKVKHIRNAGVQQVIVLDFTDEFKKISGEDFIKDILLNKFHMGAVFIGYDYRFGYQKKGDINLIKLLSDKYNFKYYILEPKKINNKLIVSSTIIKKLLKKGDIVKANRLLGYSYQISGNVIHGDKRGKKILSFPTANIEIPQEKLLPQNGVYIALVEVQDQKYKSIVNIGIKPTFQQKSSNSITSKSVEAYIFDFERDIYNKKIAVSLLKKIRGEKRFADVKKLTQQITRDKSEAEIFFRDDYKP